MPLSTDARFALLALVSLLGAVALASRESREHPVPATTSKHVEPASTQATTRAHTGEGAALRDGVRMDPSRASAAELELLPGVGPSLAKRIVESRAAHGPFTRPEDLLRVKGVGAKTLTKLMPFLRFGSEQLEHAAHPKLPLVEGSDRALLPQDAGP